MPPDMREFLPEIEKDIATLKEKCAAPDINISNLRNNLNKAIDFTQNASEYWAFCSFTGKRVIQQLVFPIGLVIDTQNR